MTARLEAAKKETALDDMEANRDKLKALWQYVNLSHRQWSQLSVT
jgi:hypothetical protein